jgi:hypothetical protein
VRITEILAAALTAGALLAGNPAYGGKHFHDREGSMEHFFDKLHALETGRSRGPVRVLFYGTSEIGYDRVTSQIRRIFQRRFGDGGKGYMIIYPVWSILRHQDIDWKWSKSWVGKSMRYGTLSDGRYGLGGVVVHNAGRAWATFRTPTTKEARKKKYFGFPAGTRFARFELHYQAYPGGGMLEIDIDNGARKETVNTSSPEVQDRVLRLDVGDGPHTVKLATDDKPSRIYGVAFDRGEGVVLDALMNIGGWAHNFLNYDLEHLNQQIEGRKPDLVIFQFGAKEAFIYPDYGAKEVATFVRDYAEGVTRVMSGQPEASCLIISNKDMGITKRRKIVTRSAVPRIVKGCKKVSRRTLCAFYNIYEDMGGEGTMRAWRSQRPPLVSSDLGHLLDAGAIKTGDIIAKTLLGEYEAYLREKKVAP